MFIWELISSRLPVNMCLILAKPHFLCFIMFLTFFFPFLHHRAGRRGHLWLLLMSFIAIVSGFLKTSYFWSYRKSPLPHNCSLFWTLVSNYKVFPGWFLAVSVSLIILSDSMSIPYFLSNGCISQFCSILDCFGLIFPKRERHQWEGKKLFFSLILMKLPFCCLSINNGICLKQKTGGKRIHSLNKQWRKSYDVCFEVSTLLCCWPSDKNISIYICGTVTSSLELPLAH
jgi:hypothetical protein